MSENLVENEIVNEKEVTQPNVQEGKCKSGVFKCIAVFFAFIIISFVIFCCTYVPRTPEYALFETFKAVKSHDFERASYYVNIDKIAENVFAKIKEEAMNDPELANNPFAGLAYMFIDAMKENVITLVKSGFKKVVEEPNEKLAEVSDVKVAGFLVVKSYKGVKLSKDVKTPDSVKFELDVDDNDPIVFIMNKVDKTWQIVDIAGYNLMNED